jgi:hypothetical protein
VNRKLYLYIYFILIFFISINTFGNINKILAWNIPDDLKTILFKMPVKIDPSLPGPRLLSEPEYSLGRENTIYWSSDSIRSILNPLNMKLIDFEVQAIFNNIELYGPVKPDVDSATFIYEPDGLPEGIPIEYRLRYWAQDLSGLYYLSHWSLPEISIQDNRVPVLIQWDILHLQESNGTKWAIGPTLQNHVVASDSILGKIMQIVIHEKSEMIDDTFYYDLDYPSIYIDSTFPYTMWSAEKEPVILSLWIVDVAGQISNKWTKPFFWWPYEGREGKIVCFPNPFNPDRGEKSIIKVDIPDVTEARIFDPFGNFIRILKKDKSDRFFEWDGKNQNKKLVSNGGYICTIQNEENHYCKIAVLR